MDVHRQEISYKNSRHTIRPGITAWAQVRYKCGSLVDDAKKKLRYDLFHIKNIVARLDLLGSLQAIKVILYPRGAI